jgi:nucleoside-diphosphate-sugar epimerase
MKILVTGGGGFLGEHLIRALLDLNHDIVSFSRNAYPVLTSLGVTHRQGDISNSEDVTQALEGVEACFHVASKVAMWGKWSDFYKTNVLGTQNIINGCIKNNVKHLIYTSTPSVVFGDQSLEGADEELGYPKKSFSMYARSKAIAEDLALNANSVGLNVISLRPHLIYGPGDRNLIPGLLNAAKKNKLKIIGNGENLVDVIYVDNAVDAHICALNAMINNNQEAFGKAYFIGQGPVKIWEFINKVLGEYGYSPIVKSINFNLAYFIGYFVEVLFSVLSIFGFNNEKPPITRFVALQLAKHHYFKHDRALKLLNWDAKVSVNEGIKKACVD